jgi:acyl carrier protein
MPKNSVELNEVVGYIGEYLETDVSHLTPTSRLATALPALDSLKLFELVLYLEDRLGVEFDDSVMENFDSMSDLLAYVNGQLAKQRATV